MKRSAVCLAFVLSLLPALAFAEADLSLRDELKVLERGEKLPLRIPGAKYRVAVFTYEDPDRTQLGDALAALVGRQILVRFAHSSIGVLNYQGELAASAPGALSYFDKVEKVAQAQEVALSIWGMVRRSGSNVTIDTYVQLPPALIEKTFVWRVKLPKRMGGELVAHLRPERILAQRLELPGDAAAQLRAAARRLNELRAEPGDSAAVVGRLPRGAVYSLEKEEGDWIFLNAGADKSGWVRNRGNCAGDCAPLLDAANFGAALLASMMAPGSKQMVGRLSPDAEAIRDQLEAYELIDLKDPERLQETAARIGAQVRDAAKAGTVPAGGAALANASMIDNLVVLLHSEASRRAREARSHDILSFYNDLAPDRAQIGAMAFDLAEASLVDPGNVDVLHNLAILFAYAGDEQRAKLARSLAADLPNGERAQ